MLREIGEQIADCSSHGNENCETRWHARDGAHRSPDSTVSSVVE